MVTRRFPPAVALAILVPALSLAGSGVVPSPSSGEIRGTLRDAAGGAVTVAVVTVQNDETGWSAEAAVDARGEFVLRPVPAGAYRFEAAAPGFRKYAQRGVRLSPGRTVTIAARLQAGNAGGTLATLGGGHVVLGYAWNDAGYANWSHTYAVLVTPRGRVVGKVRVSFVFPEAPEYSVDYTNDVACVEIEPETGSAWLGGPITETSNPSYIPLGTYMVDFARDGGPGSAGDFHGDAIPGWDGQPETCHARYGPYYMDPVERGDIFVR